MISMENMTIIEAAQTLGGLVRTAHIGPVEDRQYQEMGLMRFQKEVMWKAINVSFL